MQTQSSTPRDDASRHRRILHALCNPALAAESAIGMRGVSVARYADGQLEALLYASDPQAAELEELQATLGEGPSITAMTERGPVFASDLGTGGPTPWVTFATEATALGVGSLWAVPLLVGAVDIGVLALHGPGPATLTDEALTEVLCLADAVTAALLTPAMSETGSMSDEALAAGNHLVTHQAMGMVMVQQGSTLDDALASLRAAAFGMGASLLQVARLVVAREIDFRGRPGDDRPWRRHDNKGEFGDEDGP